MTSDQLRQIEAALKITLPMEYREALLHYSLSTPGNDDSPLFDDAKALVELNRQYRAGFAGMQPWPEHYYFMGDDGAANCFALDLSAQPPKVLFLDHGNCQVTGVEAETFEGWLKQVTLELAPDKVGGVSNPTRLRVLLWILAVLLSAIFLWPILHRLITGKPL